MADVDSSEALRRSAETFTALVEQSPLGIYTVDADFRIKDVSAGARAVFRNVRPLLGRDFAEAIRFIWTEPFASEVIRLFRHTLETGEPYVSPGLTDMRRDLGTAESYEWQLNRVLLTDGRYGVVCYFFDSTRLQQAHQATRESEARFRALTDATAEVVYRMNHDWTEMRHLQGRGFIADTIGPSQTWLEQYIPRDDQPQVLATIQGAIRSRRPFELEHRVIRVDGSLGWTYSRAVPILDSQGEIVEWFGAASDVTRRKEAEAALRRSEARQAFLLRLGEALRALTRAADMQETAARMVGAHLQATRAFFCSTDLDAPLLQGQKLVVPDTIDTTRPSEAVAAARRRAAGARSFAAVPLLRNGVAAAAFEVHDGAPRAFTADELALMEEAAEWTWTAVERARAEAALRDSEEKYRSLFNSVDVGFCIIEVLFDDSERPVDYRFLEANPAFVQQTQLTGAIGRTIRELASEHEPFWFQVYGDIARTGTPRRFEHQAAALPVYRWYEVFAFRIGEPADHRVAVLFQDIAERKRTEANAVFLAAVADDFGRLNTPDELMQAVGARLGMHLGLSGCVFGDVDESPGNVVVHHGWMNGEVPSLKRSFRLDEYLSEDFARANRAGLAYVVHDTATDPRVDAQAYAQLRIGAFVTVPFLREGRWTAYLAATSATPRDWRTDEVELLQEFANRLFPRISRAHAEQALRASEARYRTLFESIDEGFALIELERDAEGHVKDVVYREVNRQFERYTGLKDVVGRRASELMPNLDPYVWDKLAVVADSGVAARNEHYVADLGRWYTVHHSRVGGPGSPFLTSVFDDISERKRRELEQAYLLRLSDTLRALSDALDIEAAACRLLGEQLDVDHVYYPEINEAEGYARIEREFLRGAAQPLVGVYPLAAYGWSLPLLRAAEPVVIDDLQQSSDIPPADLAAITATRQRAVLCVPLIKGGVLVRTLTVSTDMPRSWRPAEVALVRETLERTFAAAERARYEHALREADRQKTEFIAVLAHELRNPLAPIRTAMGVLRASGASTAAVEKCRDIIDRQVTQLARLLDDLLDVSRLSQGKLTLQRGTVRLGDVLADALETVRPIIDERALRLTADPINPALTLDGDAARLSQIFVNLLNNAAKYTNPHGQIVVSVERHPGAVTVRVRDTGIGLHPEMHERIFDLFTQVEDARHRAQGGLGIGLALTKRLVQMHGGTIGVESPGLGRGTTFSVTLPVAELPAGARGAAERPSSPGLTPLAARQRRVLIVDDNTDAADMLALLLDGFGCETRTVYDGESALREAAAFQPELVLLDLGLPGMDGAEVCRRLRRARGANVVIAAITGWGQDQDRHRTQRAGFDVHLVKPVEPGALTDLIQKLPST